MLSRWRQRISLGPDEPLVPIYEREPDGTFVLGGPPTPPGCSRARRARGVPACSLHGSLRGVGVRAHGGGVATSARSGVGEGGPRCGRAVVSVGTALRPRVLLLRAVAPGHAPTRGGGTRSRWTRARMGCAGRRGTSVSGARMGTNGSDREARGWCTSPFTEADRYQFLRVEHSARRRCTRASRAGSSRHRRNGPWCSGCGSSPVSTGWPRRRGARFRARPCSPGW